MKKEAVEVIERGLKNVPEFDEGGRARLLMSQQQINQMSDEPLKVEADVPATVDTAVSDSSATDSTPVVAAAN
jgi:hypothetical protein